MKKALVITAIVLLVAGICFKVNQNQINLHGLMRDFTKIISESTGADVIEAKSVYGKLNGNGNGIQYFGAVLVRKDSVGDIDALISKLDAQFEFVGYSAQDSREIDSKYLVNRQLSFDTEIDAETEYISIYFFNSYHPNSNIFDLAGH